MVVPRRRKVFSVASSPSISATTMSPFCGGGLLLDHHDVAGVDPGLDHRVALDLERVVPPGGGEHRGRHRDVVRDLLDRLDRRAGGDAAHHRQLDRAGLDARARRAGRSGRPPSTTAGWKPALASSVSGRRTISIARARCGEAADEAALLERGDQPVDAGLRAQVERVLHLVEGGRHPVRCSRWWMKCRRSYCLRVSISAPWPRPSHRSS